MHEFCSSKMQLRKVEKNIPIWKKRQAANFSFRKAFAKTAFSLQALRALESSSHKKEATFEQQFLPTRVCKNSGGGGERGFARK